MGTYQRFKELRYNGKVTYSDYELIKKEVIKKVHPVNYVHKMKKQEKENIIHTEKMIMNIEINILRID